MSIYNLTEYVNESIAYLSFNKTLLNYSYDLINKIKNEISINVKNLLRNKINISNTSYISFNQINTKNPKQYMANIVNLINNYNISIENQSNIKYDFYIGLEQLNLSDKFKLETLWPPLKQIQDEYDFVQKALLNQTELLARDFPNKSNIENNVIGSKIDDIYNLINQSDYTKLDYQSKLISEIKNYINKLIHFIYIDGLNTMSSSCEKSNCGIQENSFRSLEEKNILNNEYKYRERSFLINKTKIEAKINKNINYYFQRRIASPKTYNSENGALSQYNILYFLSELQNTILSLNQTLFGDEYSDITLVADKFYDDVNKTYLEKLRKSFDIKLVKFSTILTETSLQELNNIILERYNDIEGYIHNSTDIIRSYIFDFLDKINKTTDFAENLSGYIYNQVFGYYKILYSIIQNKFEYINPNRMNSNGIKGEIINQTRNYLIEFLNMFDSEIQNYSSSYNLNEKLSNCYNTLKNRGYYYKSKDSNKYINIANKLENQTLNILFNNLYNLVMQINFSSYIGLGFNISVEPNFDEFEFNLILDIFEELRVPLGVKGGLYIPTNKSLVQIEMLVGLNGTIGNGGAGIKLNNNLINGMTNYDTYYVFKKVNYKFYQIIKKAIDFPPIKEEIVLYKNEINNTEYENENYTECNNDTAIYEIIENNNTLIDFN